MRKLLIIPLLGMMCTPTMAYNRGQYRDAPISRVTQPVSVMGVARVKDGDTLEISGVSVRIYGIDAPEKAQTCRHRMLDTMCGLQATEMMVKIINGKVVTCTPVPGQRDKYSRTIAKCSTPDVSDLGASMVNMGYALAYRKYSMDYALSEDVAKSAKRGIWSSEFVFPWDWRKGVR